MNLFFKHEGFWFYSVLHGFLSSEALAVSGGRILPGGTEGLVHPSMHQRDGNVVHVWQHKHFLNRKKEKAKET